jgi:chromosome segregation ATPase
MRSLLAIVLAAMLLLAVPAGALAEDGRDGPLATPELAALKQAIEGFRAELAELREACGKLGRKNVEAGESAAECKARYAELRAYYKDLKAQALELAHAVREWNVRAKDEVEKFAKEVEKEEAQKREQSSLANKSLQEKLRWLEDHMLQDRIDMDLYQQRAKEARAEAERLADAAREEALAVAEKWDRKAADYASDLVKHEAERQRLVAAIAAASKPKPVVAKESPKPAVKSVYPLDKLVSKIRALDEYLTQLRTDLVRARVAGDEYKVAKLEKIVAQYEAERAELLRQVPLAKDKLRAEIRSLDEKIAYKRGEQAKAQELANAMRAAAAQVTGDAREEFLAKAAKYEAQAREWAAYAEKYEAERSRLLPLLEIVVH